MITFALITNQTLKNLGITERQLKKILKILKKEGIDHLDLSDVKDSEKITKDMPDATEYLRELMKKY